MIMMMTDPDRVAFVRISACIFLHFCFVSFTHSCQLQRPPSTGMPPCNLSHILLPRPILVFHFTSQQICLFSSHFSSTIWPCQTLHYFSRLLPWSCAAPLSRSSSISTSFTKQPTTTQKNLAITSPLPSFFCKPTRVHALAFDYLCIYYPWRYLSRTKKKDFVKEVRHRSPKKRRS